MLCCRLRTGGVEDDNHDGHDDHDGHGDHDGFDFDRGDDDDVDNQGGGVTV